MDAEVAFTLSQIGRATSPEQMFGALNGGQDQQRTALKRTYRHLMMLVHPDRVTDPAQRTEAEQATKTLNAMYQAALKRIDGKVYGSATPTNSYASPNIVAVNNRKQTYAVSKLWETGQICNTYICSFTKNGVDQTGLFKVSRLPGDNDLVKREADILQHLAADTEYSDRHIYVPALADSFRYRESGSAVIRQANVLVLPEPVPNPLEWYSLEEVRSAYPNGVTTADMAWMWRRLLVALGFAHRCGVIHGAVFPAHVWIQPEKHGLMLTDWSYAVRDPASTGERISAINSAYETWYPKEVWSKSLPRPGLDLYLGAKSMVYLLGGDPVSGKLPDSVAKKFVAHLRGTALANPNFRPQDAWRLLEEFDELLGERHFRPFVMPEKSSGGRAHNP